MTIKNFDFEEKNTETIKMCINLSIMFLLIKLKILQKKYCLKLSQELYL